MILFAYVINTRLMLTYTYNPEIIYINLYVFYNVTGDEFYYIMHLFIHVFIE